MPENSFERILETAQKHMVSEKYDLALRDFLKCLEHNPYDEKVNLWAADALIKMKRTKEASSHLLFLADRYLQDGFPQKSIAILSRTRKVDPHNEVVLNRLAELYLARGLPLEAKQVYLELIEVYKSRKDSKKLLQVFRKLLDFEKNDISLRLMKADLCMEFGLKEEAILEILLASDLLIKNRDYQKAEKILKDLFADTREVRVLAKLVQLYGLSRQEDRQMELLEENIGLVNGNRELLKALGAAFFKKGELEQAAKFYGSLFKVSREDYEPLVALGKSFLKVQKVPEAYEIFRDVIDGYLLDCSRNEEAVMLLRAVIAVQNDYLPALEKMAAIFRMCGKINSLIAINETMIAVYEFRGMKSELTGVLEEMLTLSGNARVWQDKLEKVSRDGITDKSGESGMEKIGKENAIPSREQPGGVEQKNPEARAATESKASRKTEVMELIGSDTDIFIPGEGTLHYLNKKLNEVDFFINEGFFQDAMQLLQMLRDAYPGNGPVEKRFERLRRENEDAMENGADISRKSGFPQNVNIRSVLVVDDEEVIREIIGEMLSMVKVKCVQAANGREGIRLYREHMSEIDLVLLDVEMPGENGSKVYDELLKINPAVRIIIISGYSKEYLEEKYFDSEIKNYLAKPFKIDNLIVKINQLT